MIEHLSTEFKRIPEPEVFRCPECHQPILSVGETAIIFTQRLHYPNVDIPCTRWVIDEKDHIK